MGPSYKVLRDKLTDEQIIDLVMQMGAEDYEDRQDAIIFPTICHNAIGYSASHKLYYYRSSHLFHCYSECQCSFDIFELQAKVKEVNQEEYDNFAFVDRIANLVNYDEYEIVKENERYVSNIVDVNDNENFSFKPINEYTLEVFEYFPIAEWLRDGITAETQKKFKIGYYWYDNKITIPHYDINGNLVGIRGRALDPEVIENYGKYAPIRIGQHLYNHPLSFNLYGIYENKEDIKEYKTAIIAESEKSVLQFEGWYDYNIVVASCGSSINIHQIQLLIKELGVTDIILAYDKEYDHIGTEQEQKYYKKLKDMCKKYDKYCNFYLLYDKNDLLNEKDSPFDKGKEIFEELYRNKIKID